MTETRMTVQQKTMSPSSATSPPAEKAASGYYQLYNDTGKQISVFRQEYDVPKQVFELAPGATSDEYEGGHELFFLYSNSGESTPVVWNGWDSVTYYWHFSGWPRQDVNNISSFQ
ncbi:hypothetical protein [Nocardia sp. NPDC057455]|uniref:hypothetical protein n=1 Tax=Nocardia sp. NPDC057455 TaxID=3346138 RepID=UPI00366E6876